MTTMLSFSPLLTLLSSLFLSIPPPPSSSLRAILRLFLSWSIAIPTMIGRMPLTL
jgi:hypothetical protein